MQVRTFLDRRKEIRNQKPNSLLELQDVNIHNYRKMKFSFVIFILLVSGNQSFVPRTINVPSSKLTPHQFGCQSSANDEDGTSGASPSIKPTQSDNHGSCKKRLRPRLPILCYRDSWVCINKPAGMSTHRSGGPSRKLVVSTSLKRQLARKVLPVHRLDHRTSGSLLFAFDQETCSKLHDALASDSAVKTYVCLVRGKWEKFFDSENITIDIPLNINGIEKSAITKFSLLSSAEVDGMPCSLLQVRPQTGRTHQIRRHAYKIGMPIIGDSQHGDSRVNRWWRENRGLNRLALHCLGLDIPNPFAIGGRIRLVAPLPSELRSVLEDEDLGSLWSESVLKDSRLSADWIDERGGTRGRPESRAIGKPPTTMPN